jgi:hypothetical protein
MKDYKAKDGRDDLPVFIHSELDDYGLTPIEFRVYGRLARRAGKGDATESVPNMAEGCKVSERSVQLALKLLESASLIERVERPGETTIFKLLPRDRWADAARLDSLREGVTANWKKPTPATIAPPQRVHPRNECTTTPATIAPKGTPVEVTNSATPTATQRAAPKKSSAGKPHKRDERQRDPRSNYPAIQLVKQLTGYYPRMILYDKIIETLGDHPDFQRAKDCAVEWATRGHRLDNHNWIFDWYVNGIPERSVNGSGKGHGRENRGQNQKQGSAGGAVQGRTPYDPFAGKPVI